MPALIHCNRTVEAGVHILDHDGGTCGCRTSNGTRRCLAVCKPDEAQAYGDRERGSAQRHGLGVFTHGNLPKIEHGTLQPRAPRIAVSPRLPRGPAFARA